MDKYQRLYTEAGEALTELPWESYPRPQMQRDRWLCLNGEWELTTESGAMARIRVPFCPESLLSGYEGQLTYGETLCYERMFTVPDDWRDGGRVLLHFGAVSRACTVSLNGREVCRHDNAYLPFSTDITGLLQPGANRLTVAAVNDLDLAYPWGKQRVERGGMWYTPVSGIWQTVWLEPVPERYIEAMRISADLEGADITAEGVAEGTVTCCGRTYELADGHVRIEPESPHLWSPEDPYLYEFTVESGGDLVRSYFALRTVTSQIVGGIPRLCLNGRPYFFHGLLDQGYYSDGLYTPASPDLYARDILAMKELGFNTLRKHIKVEPEQYYYECDRLGMIVWQDMVNNGRYRYLHDTILPTVGVRGLDDRTIKTDPRTQDEFIRAMEETVRHLAAHPCICAWTIFNEGWGQFDSDRLYTILRGLDDTRLIDSTSGWFHQRRSDVDSLHIYFGRLHLGRRRDLPQVLSEFGGYVYKIPGHSYNASKTYGYRLYRSRERMAEALRRIYMEQIVPLAGRGLCAAIYTQVSDVEDETNGILTYDRRVCKIRPDEMEGIAQALQEAVNRV